MTHTHTNGRGVKSIGEKIRIVATHSLAVEEVCVVDHRVSVCLHPPVSTKKNANGPALQYVKLSVGILIEVHTVYCTIIIREGKLNQRAAFLNQLLHVPDIHNCQAFAATPNDKAQQ